jgi:hypothetical protein
MLLKWNNDKEARRTQDRRTAAEKDNRLSFADQGAAGFMHEAGAGKESRPYTEESRRNDSRTSLQMMSGRLPPGSSQSRTGHRRGLSDGSTLGLMDNRGPAGGSAGSLAPGGGEQRRFGTGAVAGGLIGAAAGAGAAMEMSHLHNKREDMTKSPSSGTRVNSPFSPPLPPVHGHEEDDDMHRPLGGRSADGGWSTYFTPDIAPITDLSGSPAVQQNQYRNAGAQQHRANHPGVADSFLHAPSTRNSDVSASEYDTMPSRGNSQLRPLQLNLGPRFDPTSAAPVGVGGYGAYGSMPQDNYGRAISTSSYDASHLLALADDRISPRSSSVYPSGQFSGVGMIGNAFAVPGNPLTNPLPPVPSAQPYSQAQDQHLRNRLGIGGGGFSSSSVRGGVGGGRPSSPPTNPLPLAPTYGGGLQPLRGGREGQSPSPSGQLPAGRTGPAVRGMTESEDMSWLNINAPPGSYRRE